MQLAVELAQRGFEHAHDTYRDINAPEPSVELKNEELIEWGHALLHVDQAAHAVEIFKLATLLYPSSWNAFDSLAEAYELRDDKPNAIRHYQHELHLAPENDNARQHLKTLSPDTQDMKDC